MLLSDRDFTTGDNNLNLAQKDMNPVIGQCPICGNHLHVTRLQCRNCDTTIDGHFTLGRLYQLSPEQLEFVETFLRLSLIHI